ncbi:MAG: ABC transporter ATP-binding protein [Chloroflexi bacterium]|nr:MAG: ABC transporter ATP-binding protein [Chloroflexota bacterium]
MTDGAAAAGPAAPTAPAAGPRPGSADERNGEALVEVRDLKTYYPIKAGILRRTVGQVRAVDGVDFEVRRGEVFGLVGESGCGKTTLGRTIVRLEKATSGQVLLDGGDVLSFDGRDLKKMRRRMQVIFQDPVGSLNPRMPISDIIGEGLLAQADKQNGWGERKVRDKRVSDYLEVVGLRRDYTRRYPHEFSGGQRQRIGIARALALSPEFIFADEPVSALDVSIQSQILNLLIDLREQFDLTFLFVAHNLSVVQYISDRVGVMYLGKLVEMADVAELYAHPRHPYTIALLSAIPDPDPRVKSRRLVLTGDVPSPANPPSGCRFHTRCWLRRQLNNPENCETEDPPFRELASGHRVACHWAESVVDAAVADVVPTADIEVPTELPTPQDVGAPVVTEIETPSVTDVVEPAEEAAGTAGEARPEEPQGPTQGRV